MMAFAVKRILNHTYIAVPADSGDVSYGRNVLAANRIPGLLTCRVEHLDGKTMLLFDVTSRQSLKVFLDKRRISADVLRAILSGILTAAENLEEYLLDPGHFVLRPEYVFLDAAAEETGLIYDTGFEGDFYEGLKALAGCLLENIPEDDHEAILLGYRFCHELDAPARSTEALMGLLAAKGPAKEPPGDLYAADMYEPFRETEVSLFRETENGETSPAGTTVPPVKKAGSRKRSGLFAAAAAAGGFSLVLLIYTTAVLMPAYPPGQMPVWYFAVPAAGLAAAAALLFYLRRRGGGAGSAEKNSPPANTLGEGAPGNLFPDLYAPAENEDPPPAGALFVAPASAGGDPETQILSGSSVRQERTARLIPEDAAAAYGVILLSGTETRIGKLSEAVDAVIPSPVISRIHARVIRRENGWYLEDLNSRNGTYVNGKIVPPGGIVLADGDKVRFADAGFVFRVQ